MVASSDKTLTEPVVDAGSPRHVQRFWIVERRREPRLGSGVVRSVLGEGGMAVVYEIWNEKLGVRRAVKVLKPDCSAENRERFETEIKVTAQLDHPNVIRIHSVGEWHGQPFIEMEHVDGFSLAQAIKQYGALPLDVVLSISLIVSRALSYTHTHEYTVFGKTMVGLLHRDLKPENILISKKGCVKLTDFGIATPVKVSMHTPDGNIVGSLQYTAPEQLKEQDVDHRSDIFSFGCVMYEMLTGFKAFPDRTLSTLVPKRLKNDFDSLKTYKLDVPSRLKTLVEECMELDTRKRPADMATVAAELGRIHSSLTTESPERTVERYVKDDDRPMNFVPLRRRQVKPAVVVLAAGLTILVALGVLVKPMADFSRKPQVTGPTDQTLMAPASAAMPAAPVTQTFDPAVEKQLSAAAVAEMMPTTAHGYVDQLKAEFGTNDLMVLMVKMDQERDYTTVLKLFDQLPPARAKTARAIVLKTRALEKKGKLTQAFIDKNEARDAEFYLAKARFLLKNERYSQALTTLAKAESVPAALTDKQSIRRMAVLCKAQCITALFRRRPDSDLERDALEAWRAVKEAFQDSASSSAYKLAEKETRRFESM